jgi:hypothetical protein
MTDITLKMAADILAKSEDELMFLVQTNKIQAGVDDTTLAWKFDLNEVVAFKKQLDEGVIPDQKLLVE